MLRPEQAVLRLDEGVPLGQEGYGCGGRKILSAHNRRIEGIGLALLFSVKKEIKVEVMKRKTYPT